MNKLTNTTIYFPDLTIEKILNILKIGKSHKSRKLYLSYDEHEFIDFLEPLKTLHLRKNKLQNKLV